MKDSEGVAACERMFLEARDANAEMFHGDMCTVNNKLDLPQWSVARVLYPYVKA